MRNNNRFHDYDNRTGIIIQQIRCNRFGTDGRSFCNASGQKHSSGKNYRIFSRIGVLLSIKDTNRFLIYDGEIYSNYETQYLPALGIRMNNERS